MFRRVGERWPGFSAAVALGLAASLGCVGTWVDPDQEDISRKRAASHYNIAVDHMENGLPGQVF